jgi:hypothetical protein
MARLWQDKVTKRTLLPAEQFVTAGSVPFVRNLAQINLHVKLRRPKAPHYSVSNLDEVHHAAVIDGEHVPQIVLQIRAHFR